MIHQLPLSTLNADVPEASLKLVKSTPTIPIWLSVEFVSPMVTKLSLAREGNVETRPALISVLKLEPTAHW